MSRPVREILRTGESTIVCNMDFTLLPSNEKSMKPATGGGQADEREGGGNFLRGFCRRRCRQGQPGKQPAAWRDQWERGEKGRRMAFFCAQGLALQRWSTCLPLLFSSLLLLLLGRVRDATRKCVVKATTFIAHEALQYDDTELSRAEPSLPPLRSASQPRPCMYLRVETCEH